MYGVVVPYCICLTDPTCFLSECLVLVRTIFNTVFFGITCSDWWFWWSSSCLWNSYHHLGFLLIGPVLSYHLFPLSHVKQVKVPINRSLHKNFYFDLFELRTVYSFRFSLKCINVIRTPLENSILSTDSFTRSDCIREGMLKKWFHLFPLTSYGLM